MLNLRSDAPKLLTLGLAVLMTTPACSWIFVQPLNTAAASSGYPATCTTNVAAPVFDTIFVGTNVASVAYVASRDNVTNKGASIGLGVAVAGVWLASAVYGYSKTSQCSAYLEEKYQEPLRRRTYPPRPYPYSPPPPPPAGGWNAPPPAYAPPPAQSPPATGTQAPVPAPAAPAASPAPQQLDNDGPR